MAFKDYYKVLGLAPNATPADIKKRFRMLVLQYHPDRNNDSEFAVAKFREVQEAYNALSDRQQRIIYDREWHLRFSDTKPSNIRQTSAASLLEEARALLRFIRDADAHRLNRDFIHARLTDILSHENLVLLQHTASREERTAIAQKLMNAAQSLSWKKLQTVMPSLYALLSETEVGIEQIEQWKRKIRLNDYWERYYPLVAFLIAALVCVLIFSISS